MYISGAKFEEHCSNISGTEADKGQSQNICEIRKNVFKIRKNISNRNVFWKSSLKSLSNLKNYYKSQKNYWIHKYYFVNPKEIYKSKNCR